MSEGREAFCDQCGFAWRLHARIGAIVGRTCLLQWPAAGAWKDPSLIQVPLAPPNTAGAVAAHSARFSLRPDRDVDGSNAVVEIHARVLEGWNSGDAIRLGTEVRDALNRWIKRGRPHHHGFGEIHVEPATPATGGGR